jgi:serine phosphatase RsbU (regulator of sigma subunit)
MARADSYHPLLLRQMKRAGIGHPSVQDDPRWLHLLREVNASYRDQDDDRYLVERSLELSSRELTELNARLREERKRLERELEVASRLQTSILPPQLSFGGYETAARMVPATEVGGDYYDIIPQDDGCWIGMGDVAGHGLRAAVVMTMVQSMVSVLTRDAPNASPRDVIVALNRAVHENVFCRLRTNDHVTFCLMRCRANGEITFAGAHEVVLVYRAKSGRCERIETPGTWLGPASDIAPFTDNHSLSLGRGDMMVLYTDGVIEAKAANREEFGLDRLATLIEESQAETVGTICDRVVSTVQQWMPVQDDDLTLLLHRRTA